MGNFSRNCFRTFGLLKCCTSLQIDTGFYKGFFFDFVPMKFRDSPDKETAANRGGFSSTLARAADTLRTALMGEKTEEGPSSSRSNYSAENFELLPSDEPAAASNENPPDLEAKKKKFPTYQPASFRSWRMNPQSG